MSSKQYVVVELEPIEERADEDLEPGFALVRRVGGHDVPVAFGTTLEQLRMELAWISGRYLLFSKGGPEGPSLVGDYQTLEEAEDRMWSISYDLDPSDAFWIEREGDGVVFGERPVGRVRISEVMAGAR